jgi:hypothetical protein
LAPLRPGYTFLVLSLGAGPILALTRIPLEPFLDLYSLIYTCDHFKFLAWSMVDLGVFLNSYTGANVIVFGDLLVPRQQIALLMLCRWFKKDGSGSSTT